MLVRGRAFTSRCDPWLCWMEALGELCLMHLPVRVYSVLLAQSECTVPLVGWKGTLVCTNIMHP